ncbi:alpha-2,8-polysialyltransferase family protein [Sphaerisporangium corydalis]|uniref:Alpha-2,8-polysialyltransferase family protein n=1 Tax=Sphaerisporangium corydalis TaxID=1441875 RepID=A0ABV9EBZ9_9ACTN|nr:alpha-2,8-polysialyltransferase family protein [Sphaerisporangium corydalis]
MTQVFYSSTFFGAMTLASAMDAGRFGPHTGRRILLVSGNASVPEVTPALDEAPGFAALRRRFDEVRSWNEVIAPLHPSDWKARIIEVPMLGRLLSSHLSLDDGVEELVLESIAVPPARTVAALIRDCPITVYSDGLMSYGPTRDPLPLEISGRITRLLHLDLVPGLTPLLLTEAGVPADPLPDDTFHHILTEVSTPPPPDQATYGNTGGPATHGSPGGAMILGQYLSALEIVTADEEAELHAGMLRALVARGHTNVLFKPHPAAGRHHARRLREVAAELGVELTVAGETVPAEVCFQTARPALVVGCFSTALMTAHRLFGIPVATMGCDIVLERLVPYENSNRIPVTIVDATVPRLAPDGSITDPPQTDLPGLVNAVGFCMQSENHPSLREAAARYIETHGTQARYFKTRRLTSVGLLPTPDPPKPKPLSRLRRALSR